MTHECTPHGQTCPDDGALLDCRDDYIGGGSHYWVLACPRCSEQFTYDTYSFELRHEPSYTGLIPDEPWL